MLEMPLAFFGDCNQNRGLIEMGDVEKNISLVEAYGPELQHMPCNSEMVHQPSPWMRFVASLSKNVENALCLED